MYFLVSLPFYGFICDNLGFPSVKSSKIFTAHRILRDKRFKHEKSSVCKGSFFCLCKFMSFKAAISQNININININTSCQLV